MKDDPGARRVALVTGGSRGIGRAVVERLAADGHDVSFCYRTSEESARSLVDELAANGGRAIAHAVDVADAAAVREMAARTSEELGPIEVVVTCAGIIRDQPLALMTDDEWHSVVSTNLSGTYNVCRAVVFEMMKRNAGSIINMSSVAGVQGNPTQANYSASKAGIIGFTRALAKEVARYGIRVNAVAPGFIETDMTAGLSHKARQQALERIPMRRVGQPHEVAELVGFLASERSAYITGAVLHVDGGITL
ncbi:MAG: 3-oxoacyl-[acyl-carrier-protein] reductase [Solirubrobacteraceae bacterium]